MTDDPRDETQAMSGPFDEDGDPTQLMPSGDADDPTRVIPADDEATRRMAMPAAPADDATRRLDRTPPASAPTRRISRRTVSSAPATERIPLPAQRRGLANGLIATIVVIALAVGGVVGYQQHRPSDANVVARGLVGPGGGVMTFDQRGKLTVPEGALPSPTAITVRRVAIEQRVRLGAEGESGSVTYEPGELVVYAFEPADLRFQQPITIELPRNGDGSAVFIDARGAPRVAHGMASGDVVTIQTSTFTFEDVQG